ncbi:MAG TPA: hypothetical protein V6C86_13850 [Oculatellaceae cyanobacterium]
MRNNIVKAVADSFKEVPKGKELGTAAESNNDAIGEIVERNFVCASKDDP